jgi:dienelactone hydrolase
MVRWLWKQAAKKPSKGNLPLVILVHGSGETHNRSYFCEQVNRLVKKGYVVFMPYMRGVTDTSTADTEGGWRSTGTYIEDYVADHSDGSADSNTIYTLSYMLWEAQDEVQFALTRITNMTSGDGSKPLVNPDKIAIMGHSYGGAVVTIAASQSLSPLPATSTRAASGWAGSILGGHLDAYAAQHQMAPTCSRP